MKNLSEHLTQLHNSNSFVIYPVTVGLFKETVSRDRDRLYMKQYKEYSIQYFWGPCIILGLALVHAITHFLLNAGVVQKALPMPMRNK